MIKLYVNLKYVLSFQNEEPFSSNLIVSSFSKHAGLLYVVTNVNFSVKLQEKEEEDEEDSDYQIGSDEGEESDSDDEDDDEAHADIIC